MILVVLGLLIGFIMCLLSYPGEQASAEPPKLKSEIKERKVL